MLPEASACPRAARTLQCKDTQTGVTPASLVHAAWKCLSTETRLSVFTQDRPDVLSRVLEAFLPCSDHSAPNPDDRSHARSTLVLACTCLSDSEVLGEQQRAHGRPEGPQSTCSLQTTRWSRVPSESHQETGQGCSLTGRPPHIYDLATPEGMLSSPCVRSPLCMESGRCLPGGPCT